MNDEAQRNFWNQIWKQHDRIKESRGEADAAEFLRKIVDRLSHEGGAI